MPVRIGNGAFSQQQHDVWGAVLDSVYLHVRSRERTSEALWPVLKRQVEEAAAHWEQPDAGIWEVRGEPKHFTSSKLMCWVAMDRGAKLARLHEEPEYARKWQALADQIHADICDNGVDSRGVFTQHYGSDALDASLLLMPLMRFLPAGRPADPGDGAGHRRRAHRGRSRPALPDPRDRRRAARRGGLLHDLLVLARVRARRDRRGARGPASSASACSPTPARSSSTPRRSTRRAAVTSATSRRRSRTWRRSTRWST